LDDRRVRLAVAAWSAIMLVVIEDFSTVTDWPAITAEMVAARFDGTVHRPGRRAIFGKPGRTPMMLNSRRLDRLREEHQSSEFRRHFLIPHLGTQKLHR
jgi:hypothetical protein